MGPPEERANKLINEGHNVDVVFLDFSKALDQVPHVRLYRLERME